MDISKRVNGNFKNQRRTLASDVIAGLKLQVYIVRHEINETSPRVLRATGLWVAQTLALTVLARWPGLHPGWVAITASVMLLCHTKAKLVWEEKP